MRCNKHEQTTFHGKPLYLMVKNLGFECRFSRIKQSIVKQSILGLPLEVSVSENGIFKVPLIRDHWIIESLMGLSMKSTIHFKDFQGTPMYGTPWIYWKTPRFIQASCKMGQQNVRNKARHHGFTPGSNLCATARPGHQETCSACDFWWICLSKPAS